MTTPTPAEFATVLRDFFRLDNEDGYVAPHKKSDGDEDLTDVTIDGHFDFVNIATAILTATTPDDKTVEAGKDALDLELTATLPNGVIVPVEVSIVYPEGNGFHAVKAVQMLMDQNINQLFNQLIQRQDASIVQALLASGHQMDEED